MSALSSVACRLESLSSLLSSSSLWLLSSALTASAVLACSMAGREVLHESVSKGSSLTRTVELLILAVVAVVMELRL